MSATGAIANDKTRVKTMALGFIGLDPVGVDDGVKTERGRLIEVVWEETWNYALEQDLWNFATRRVPLTFYAGSDLDINVENHCQYQKPYDFVRGYGLGSKANLCCRAHEHVNFRVVNSRLILEKCGSSRSSSCCCSCIEEHDTIYYIANSISVAECSATFRDYLAYLMAIRLHRRFRSDDRSLLMLENKARELLKEAKNLDRSERNTVKKEECEASCHKALHAFKRNRSGYIA